MTRLGLALVLKEGQSQRRRLRRLLLPVLRRARQSPPSPWRQQSHRPLASPLQGGCP